MHKIITKDEIRDALSRSGYLLETRVDSLLKRRGYFVQSNANFEDAETGKSRELDIHALTARNCGDRLDFLWPVLTIECINNPQPIVFFTKTSIAAFLHKDAIAMSGLPMKVWPKQGAWGESVSLLKNINVEKWHHYCRGRTASQYCSFTPKKGGGQSPEWMAQHEGSHFDTMKKLCDAVDYFRDEHFQSWRFNGVEHVNLQIYYPILVVQGELLELRSGRPSAAVRAIGHAQFRQAVATKGIHRNYQIDVVQERALPRLLQMIEKDVNAMVRRLKYRRVIVSRAVERIAKRARRARSAESVRKIMGLE
jgi:hypothetical protein